MKKLFFIISGFVIASYLWSAVACWNVVEIPIWRGYCQIVGTNFPPHPESLFRRNPDSIGTGREKAVTIRAHNLPSLDITKYEGWKTYCVGDYPLVWFTSDTLELLVCFNPEDFAGVQYPCWIKKLKQVFYNHYQSPWQSTQFKFRIYAEDIDSVLYESPVLDAIKPDINKEAPTEYNLGPDSVEIDSGKFWVSIYDSKINAWAPIGDNKWTKHSFIRNTNTGEVDSPPWFTPPGSELATYVYLAYTLLEHDVAPISYTSPPDSVKVDTAYPVSFTVKNKGSNMGSFIAGCVILTAGLDIEYAQTQNITSLGSGDTQVVTLPNWTPALYGHSYTVIFSTELSGDMIPQNDTLVEHSTTYEVSIEEAPPWRGGYPWGFRITHFRNPIKGQFSIEYTVPTKMNISINLYDISGRLVRVLENGALNAGTHKSEVPVAELSPGVYFLRTKAEKFTMTQKVILFK